MYYSNKKNVLQLVALLKAHGVRKVVLCPGSRNAAIVHTLANVEDFICYPVTDERSAGFFAIGLSLQGGGPVAVCCTSGSALLNLHPAVAEAFYQQVPLIVISADRPAAWIGQMDGQTLPQAGGVRFVGQVVGQPAGGTDGGRGVVLQPADKRGDTGDDASWKRTCAYQCADIRTYLPFHGQGIARGARHYPLSGSECL